MRKSIAAALLFAVFFLLPSAARAGEGRSAPSGTVVFALREQPAGEKGTLSARSLLAGAGIFSSGIQRLERTGVYLADGGSDPGAAAGKLAELEGVAWAEPSLPLTWFDAPEDEHYWIQWSLSNTASPYASEELSWLSGFAPVNLTAGADVDAPRAWTVTRGDPSVVVAVMDTGIGPYIHDLDGNLWVNGGEIPGNDIDDDGNGFIDDVNGWNALDGNGNISDQGEHGSHCAGIIAARQDEYGISGIAPDVRIMALVGFETAHVLANTEYLLAQKARGVNVRAVNMSFGTGIPYSRAIEEALAKLEEGGVLVFAAAGNFATDNDFASFSYPSSLPFGNIVSVGSTGGTDEPSNFSQWGRRTVDIHAPGEAILSTIPSKYVQFGYSSRIDGTWNTWTLKSGTSMSTPLTLGAAALLFSAHPEADWRAVKAQLLSAADRLPSLEGLSRTGGRLNAGRALTEPLRTRPALFRLSSQYPLPGEQVRLSGHNLTEGGALSLVSRDGRKITLPETGRTSGEAVITLPPGELPDARVTLEIGGDGQDSLTSLPFLLTHPGEASPADIVFLSEGGRDFHAVPVSGQAAVAGEYVYGTAGFEELNEYGNLVRSYRPAVFSLRDRTLRKAPLGEEGEEWARTDLDFRYTSYCSLGRTVFLAGQSTGGWVYAYDTGEGVLRRLTRLPEELRESNLGSPATAVGGKYFYLAGGFILGQSLDLSDRTIDSVYRLDLETLEWRRWGTLSEKRFAAAAAIEDGKLFVAGGKHYELFTVGTSSSTVEIPTSSVNVFSLENGSRQDAVLPFSTWKGTLAIDREREAVLFFGGLVYFGDLSMASPLAAWTSPDGRGSEWELASPRFPFISGDGGWAFSTGGTHHLLSRGWGDQYDRGYQLFSLPSPESSPAGCTSGVSPWGALLLVPLALLLKKQ